MPKDTPIMRAPTGKERIADSIRGAYESLSEQPLVRIADMLGLSNIKGVAKSLYEPSDPMELKVGMMPMGPSSSLGRALAPNVQRMHPSVPPEFHAVEKPRMPESRTAPIDMNNPPSGKIEYLDPDVAEYMNPKRILDTTTPEAQRRIRILSGK